MSADKRTVHDEYLPDEFWHHYQNYTGNIVPPDNQRSFFSCSC